MTDKTYKAIGRRKEATALVKLSHGGKGDIVINGIDYRKYFPSVMLQEIVAAALKLTGKLSEFDIEIKTSGGGMRGQADSARLGIARGLLKYNPEFKIPLRAAGFLTRDPRVKERKKYGLKRARRAPQWQKR